MYMEYSYKFRIYPSATQAQQIQRTFGCCRFVWNYYLAMRKEIYEQDSKTMNYYDCSKDMTQLKKKPGMVKGGRCHCPAILSTEFRRGLSELLSSCEAGTETWLSKIQKQAKSQKKLQKQVCRHKYQSSGQSSATS